MAVLDAWTSVIDRQSRQSELFGKMMKRFGVFEPDRAFTLLDGLALGRAARVCLHCAAADKCKTWVETEGPLSEAERFCPNARLFRDLGR